MPTTINRQPSTGHQVPHGLTQQTRPNHLDLAGVSRGFLATAIRTGSSLRALSRLLGLSVHHVYQLCLHYGLARGKNTPPDMARTLRQQATAGASPVHLAQQYAMSCYRVMAMLGEPSRKATGTGASRVRYRDHHRSSRAARGRPDHRTRQPQWRHALRPTA